MRKLFIYTVALLLLVSCKRDVVDAALKVDFSYTVADNNYSVPVKISFLNDCANAKYYQWSFEGGNHVGAGLPTCCLTSLIQLGK